MANTVTNHIKMVMTDVDNNNNKFWEMWEYADGSTKTRWGRVSETDKTQEKTYPPGNKGFESTWKSKERKGYKKVETIGGSDEPNVKVATVDGGGLKDLAVRQIANGDKIVEALVSYLVRKNRHTITKNTSIKYDEATGLFRTPIGIVTQRNIDDARQLLSDISDVVREVESKKAESLFDSSSYKTNLANYLMLIPTDVGRNRGWHQTFLPNMNAVSAQNSILDALQASLDTVLSGGDDKKNKTTKKNEEQVWNVKVKLNEDVNEINRIKTLYNSTKQKAHSSHKLDVVKVYDVSIAHMDMGFETFGIKMQNIWELWHGTQASNILSILSKGMIIPPSSAAHCTGRMFGDGIYASDQSTKALNYAYGYWGGAVDSNCFMFLLDMAMGKYFVPPGPFSTKRAPQGFDSTFAKGGKSAVMNNEMIVYDIRQIRVKKLVEFASSR